MKQLILTLVLLGSFACSSARAPAAATPPATQESPRPDPNAAESWRRQRPSPGPRAELVYPAPEVTRLPNGLTLYVLQRPAEVVELSFVTRHGASSAPAGKSGLAALTARMLTEGTRQRSSLALAETVESLGTTLKADAGRDHSSVGLTTLRQDFPRGLALLAEVIRTPAFAPKELERVRAEWLDGLLAERQQPQRLSALVGLRALYGTTLGAPVSGSVPDVKRLTAGDLVAFHRQHYAPDSAALIVVGDVKLADVRGQVERLFGDWKARSAAAVPVTPPPDAPLKPEILLVDRPDAVQTALFIAQPLPRRDAPGYEAREVLANLLGGLFTSRINQNLREEHAYTYGARASAVATRHWGALVISTSVKTDATAPALREVQRELAALRGPKAPEPITREELERSKADLINSLGAQLEHTSRVADDLAGSFALGLPTDYATRYAPLVESLTAETVARESERLTPDALLIVAVGDRKAIGPALQKAGYTVRSADPALLD